MPVDRNNQDRYGASMSRKVTTEYCEHCQRKHVTEERVTCDACGGLICMTEPKTVEWFGTGVYSEIHEFMPEFGSLPRVPIVVIYDPKQSSTVFRFYFCCLAHMLAFLRNLPPGYLPIDEIRIEGTVSAFAQIPVQEIPEAE